MIRSLLIAFSVLVSSCVVALAEVQVGKEAPDFVLTDTNGKSHHLSDYKGKYVVLEWYQPDCPFVRKHYNSGNMQALQKECVYKGVFWWSIYSSAAGKEENSPPDHKNQIPTK